MHDGIMNDFILWCVEYLIEQSGTKKHIHNLNFINPCSVIGGCVDRTQ